MKLEQVADRIVGSVQNYVDRSAIKRINELERRLEAIEAQAAYIQNFWLRGVWREGDEHRCGNLVIHQGGLWHADLDTTDRPGTSTAWRLCVKRGTVSE